MFLRVYLFRHIILRSSDKFISGNILQVTHSTYCHLVFECNKIQLLQFGMSSSNALWKFNFRFCSGDSWEEGGPWCFLERQEAETILILLTAHCLFRCQLFLHLPGWSMSRSGCDESHVSFLSALWIAAGKGQTEEEEVQYTALIGMAYEVVIKYALYFEFILQQPCWKI